MAAWFYTGGSRPYGYRGLGEVSVFVFFGLVATVGTTFVQAGEVTTASVLAGVGCGALACAILVANNLRDLETDRVAGKHTLAVRLGDQRTRWFYVSLLVAALAALVAIGVIHAPAFAVLTTAVPAARCARVVLQGARGRDLVPVLKMTGSVLLALRRPARCGAGPRHLELTIVRPAGPRPTMGQCTDHAPPCGRAFMIAKDPVAARHEIFRDHEVGDSWVVDGGSAGRSCMRPTGMSSGSATKAIHSSMTPSRWTSCGPEISFAPRAVISAHERVEIVDAVVDRRARHESLVLGATEVEPHAAGVEERHRLAGHCEEVLETEDVAIEGDGTIQVGDGDVDLSNRGTALGHRRVLVSRLQAVASPRCFMM